MSYYKTVGDLFFSNTLLPPIPQLSIMRTDLISYRIYLLNWLIQ